MYYLCHFFARYTVNEITSDSTNTFSLPHNTSKMLENIIQTVPHDVFQTRGFQSSITGDTYCVLLTSNFDFCMFKIRVKYYVLAFTALGLQPCFHTIVV